MGVSTTRRTRILGGLLLCLCGQLSGSALAQAAAPVAAAVPQDAGLRAAIESGRPGPLDALTPHGKRQFLAQINWRDEQLLGFNTSYLIRELDAGQLAEVLRFLDSSEQLAWMKEKLVGSPLRLPAPSAQLEQDLQQFRLSRDRHSALRASREDTATEVGAPDLFRLFHELFGARMTPAMLASQPVGELLPLFDAALMAAFDNPASAAVDQLLLVHGELARRGVDTRRYLDDSLLQTMLTGRRFEQARAFAAKRPHLARTPVPRVVDKLGASFTGRSVYEYDARRDTLRRRALPASPGMELVMVVGEGCHNSDNALKAIGDDAGLRARLRKANLVLVTSPTGSIDRRLMARWNTANPSMPIRAPYNAQEWKAVSMPSIPAFYLLEDGKVIDQRTGWPAEGKAELVKLIEAAGK